MKRTVGKGRTFKNKKQGYQVFMKIYKKKEEFE